LQPEITVGQDACPLVNYTNSSTVLQCNLTAASGLGKRVVVTRAAEASVGDASVSFAAPTVTRVEGCVMGENQNECPRTGGVITVHGANFGPSSTPVSIMVGATLSTCNHTADAPHSRLSCELPKGAARDLLVLCITDSGVGDTNTTLTYLQVHMIPGHF
jgi:hypothetical protein